MDSGRSKHKWPLGKLKSSEIDGAAGESGPGDGQANVRSLGDPSEVTCSHCWVTDGPAGAAPSPWVCCGTADPGGGSCLPGGHMHIRSSRF